MCKLECEIECFFLKLAGATNRVGECVLYESLYDVIKLIKWKFKDVEVIEQVNCDCYIDFLIRIRNKLISLSLEDMEAVISLLNKNLNANLKVIKGFRVFSWNINLEEISD